MIKRLLADKLRVLDVAVGIVAYILSSKVIPTTDDQFLGVLRELLLVAVSTGLAIAVVNALTARPRFDFQWILVGQQAEPLSGDVVRLPLGQTETLHLRVAISQVCDGWIAQALAARISDGCYFRVDFSTTSVNVTHGVGRGWKHEDPTKARCYFPLTLSSKSVPEVGVISLQIQADLTNGDLPADVDCRFFVARARAARHWSDRVLYRPNPAVDPRCEPRWVQRKSSVMRLQFVTT